MVRKLFRALSVATIMVSLAACASSSVSRQAMSPADAITSAQIANSPADEDRLH